MFLGLANVLTSIRRNFIPWIKDGLKLHYFFRQNSDLKISHASTGSCSFDGTDDYVAVNSLATSLRSENSFSISFWAKPDTASSDPASFALNTGTDASKALVFYANSSDGGNGVRLWYNGATIIDEDGVTRAGAWHHYAYVQNGATSHSVYVDGVLIETDTTSKTLDSGLDTATIGGTASFSQYYNGSICQVGIWSRALSASEIQGIMYKKYADLGSVDKTSLVSFWGLDVDYDDAHGSNDGTNSGSTLTTSVYGDNAPQIPRILDVAQDSVKNFGTLKSGTALSFDGTNDYVDCGTALGTALGDNVTALSVSLWFKSDAWGNDGIFQMGDFASTQGEFSLIAHSSGIIFKLSNGGYDQTHTYSDTTSWHHIVALYDGSNGKLYLDGVKVLDASHSTDLDLNGLKTIVGAYYSASYPFDGKMSNVKVFSEAIDQDAVRELFLNPEQILPTGVSSSNLKLYLPMNEGDGDYTYDGSGNQNHGTISGATWDTANTDIAQVGLVRQNSPMVFDGSDDYVSLGSAVTLADSTEWSINFWFIQETDDIMSVGERGNNDNRFYHRISGEDYVQIHLNSTNITLDFNGSVSLGVWHYMSVVCDGSGGMTLYIDGVAQGTSSGISNTQFVVDSFGNPFTTSDYSWDGSINEVAIWDVALDADAVTALYNSGTPLDATADSGNYDNSGDLQGYWRNDNDTTWTDRSTNSNNGTASGSPDSIVLTEGLTSGRDSQGFYLTDTTENCLTLNGAEYVDIPDSEVLSLTTSATWELWMNQDVIDVQSGVVGKGTSTANMITFYTWDDGNFYFDIRDGSTQYGYFDYSTAISADTWHHLTVVFDGSLSGNANRLKVYVDSVQQTLAFYGTMPSTLPTNTASQFIGKSETAGTPFNGKIDDVRIYSQALSSDEVTKNYNAGKSKHS